MDKYVYDEDNGLRYELQADYYIPFFYFSENVRFTSILQ